MSSEINKILIRLIRTKNPKKRRKMRAALLKRGNLTCALLPLSRCCKTLSRGPESRRWPGAAPSCSR